MRQAKTLTWLDNSTVYVMLIDTANAFDILPILNYLKKKLLKTYYVCPIVRQ